MSTRSSQRGCIVHLAGDDWITSDATKLSRKPMLRNSHHTGHQTMTVQQEPSTIQGLLTQVRCRPKRMTQTNRRLQTIQPVPRYSTRALRRLRLVGDLLNSSSCCDSAAAFTAASASFCSNTLSLIFATNLRSSYTALVCVSVSSLSFRDALTSSL